MTIHEQADRGRDGFRYCWMLDRGYGTRSEMASWGWKWLRGAGCRGVFVTDSPAAVAIARQALRLDAPRSNGTHAVLGAPMFTN